MWATCRILSNFTSAIGTPARFNLWRFFLMSAQSVDKLHKHKDTQSHNQKIKYCLKKISDGNYRSVFTFAQYNRQSAKVHAACNRGNNGRKDIIDRAGNYIAKGRAYYDAHGHIDDIAAKSKLFKFLNILFHDASRHVLGNHTSRYPSRPDIELQHQRNKMIMLGLKLSKRVLHPQTRLRIIPRSFRHVVLGPITCMRFARHFHILLFFQNFRLMIESIVYDTMIVGVRFANRRLGKP